MAGRDRSFSTTTFKIAPVMTRSRSTSSVRRQGDVERENPLANSNSRSTSDPVNIHMARFELQSKKAMEQSKMRVQNMATVERIILANGIEKASDILIYDPFILSLILTVLNENNSWDIGLAHAFLPVIVNNEMLLEPYCVSACLDSLKLICDTLLEKVINATQQSSLGVDVAADERREKSTKILQHLCNLRDTRQTLCKKMSQDDASLFDQITQNLPIL